MKEINLEYGHPTVLEAIDILKLELSVAKKQKEPCLKLIHGYGSSGKGGKIRTAVRKYLSDFNTTFIITGENFSIFDENTRNAFKYDKTLRNDPDLDRHNNGVTFIIL